MDSVNDSFASVIKQKIRNLVLPLEKNGCDVISPNHVAAAVLRLIDPHGHAPDLVEYCTTMDLRQRCRKFLQHRHDPMEKVHGFTCGISDDPFGGVLQDYYPAKREDNGEEAVYVRRDQMSFEELDYVAERMRKAGNSLVRHADALSAFAATRYGSRGVITPPPAARPATHA
jgi:hypothetical protein